MLIFAAISSFLTRSNHIHSFSLSHIYFTPWPTLYLFPEIIWENLINLINFWARCLDVIIWQIRRVESQQIEQTLLLYEKKNVADIVYMYIIKVDMTYK